LGDVGGVVLVKLGTSTHPPVLATTGVFQETEEILMFGSIGSFGLKVLFFTA
jgi:hypothetical protein